MRAEMRPDFKLAKRIAIGQLTAALLLIPGVMQTLLTAHPLCYSVGVIIILLRLFFKEDPMKCLLSMALLSSTLIISCCLQRYQNEIVGYVRLAIERPDFLGL